MIFNFTLWVSMGRDPIHASHVFDSDHRINGEQNNDYVGLHAYARSQLKQLWTTCTTDVSENWFCFSESGVTDDWCIPRIWFKCTSKVPFPTWLRRDHWETNRTPARVDVPHIRRFAVLLYSQTCGVRQPPIFLFFVLIKLIMKFIWNLIFA